MKWDRNLYHALICSFSAVYTGTQQRDLYVGPMRQPRERRELVGVCVCVGICICVGVCICVGICICMCALCRV